MNQILKYFSLLGIFSLVSCNAARSEDPLALDGDCRLLSFKAGGYEAEIDHSARTARILVPEDFDASAMEVEAVEVPEGVAADIVPGMVLNLNFPQTLTVTCGDLYNEYTITVYSEVVATMPEALFVSTAAKLEDLVPEEKAAAEWMLSNVEGAEYASFESIALGRTKLDQCKLIWWHFHVDGGVDSAERFEAAATSAINAKQIIRGWYAAGGKLLLTRYATFYAAYIGATSFLPNNCWGGLEDQPETVGGPWNFFIGGSEKHSLYGGLVMNSGETDRVYTFDASYRTTNSTAQWHIGSDWGGYPTLEQWRSATGAVDLGYGSDGAVVVWEFPASGRKGTVLCIGSGCYDWYAHEWNNPEDRYHSNVAKLTQNAITYMSNL